MLSRACLRCRALRNQPMPRALSLLCLLLLPLGLGGCWERVTRSDTTSVASSGLYNRPTLSEDDIPTPRLFQINLSHGQSE